MIRLLVLSLAGLLVVSTVAAEAKPRATQAKRKAPEERNVTADRGAIARPLLVVPEDLESRIFMSEQSASARRPREEKAAQMLESMLHEREKLVDERRRLAIKRLEKFVGDEPDNSSHMAEGLLRLAELRWEIARKTYLDAFSAWQGTPKDRRPDTPPRADIDVPLGLYDRILTGHRDFDRYDLVLYMKAYALIEIGRTGEALKEYRRIIDEYPSSRFLPDAHMAFAEWHFAGSYDYSSALKEYDEVLKHPQSELSDLALFKSAWCLWKLNRITDAATRFREVLDLSGKLQGITTERRRRLLELQNEALEYLIQVFTEDERNTAADLHNFLSEIGGEQYAGRVLRRLSRTFFDQSRYDRAVEAYRMLLGSEPDSPDAPEYQRQIAASYSALGDPDKTIEALTMLASRFGPKSSWAAKQADPTSVPRAQRASERAVRMAALRYHERAQKEKQKKDFEHAVSLYSVHITHFPESASNYEVTFYLAEILFHRLERHAEAGDLYLAAARKDARGEFTQDALYNAIMAFEQVRVAELESCKPAAAGPAPKKTGTQKNAPDSAASGATPAEVEATDVCGETATDQKFSEAIAYYIELYPQDPEVPGILFRQGRMYFERGIYDPAVRQFGQLLDSYPRSEFAAQAGELVLESFNRAADYGNIETWARRLKAAPAFQNGESQRKLDALILQSVFKAGEQLAERGEHAKAAAAYERAAQEFPKDKRSAQAYFNAGQQWQRAGDLGAAAEAYDGLIDRYPGSEVGALGAWTAAQMFESIAQFRDAARYYESYSKRFPKGEKRADALYNAVVLRLAAGDHDPAVEDGKAFAAAFKKHKLADEVQFMIGRAHEAAERWDDAARLYRQVVRRGRDADRKIEAQTRLALALLERGDPRGADKALKAAVKAGRRNAKKLTTGRYFSAQARFIQADQVLLEFEKIKIAGDMRGLPKRLEKKSELLKSAAAIYSDVVDFKVAEWVTAALYKIGRSYELFAESLRDAPIPEGLSEEEEQAYRDQLAMFIVPIEERALEAYEGGYHKALELRVFNSWTEKQREALTRLNDVQYPPLREIGGDISEARPLPLPTPYAGLRRAP